jgi:prevent-host-death family protein
MSSVELEEAKERLAELVEQAAQGEDVVITRNGKPLARIVPIRRTRQFGSAKGLIEMAEDFDAAEPAGSDIPNAVTLPQWQKDLLKERLANSSDEVGRDWECVKAEIWPQA